MQGVFFACFIQLGFNVRFQPCPFWIGVSAKAWCYSANLEMSPGLVGSQSHSEAVLALWFFFFSGKLGINVYLPQMVIQQKE